MDRPRGVLVDIAAGILSDAVFVQIESHQNFQRFRGGQNGSAADIQNFAGGNREDLLVDLFNIPPDELRMAVPGLDKYPECKRPENPLKSRAAAASVPVQA